MSLYYSVDIEGYKGDANQIGDIMQNFAMELHNKTGLNLRLNTLVTDEVVKKLFFSDGTECLNEEVLWRNLSDDDKVKKVLSHIEKVSDKRKDELIVIDPYLFCKHNVGEEQNLQRILTGCKYKKIIAVVSKGKTNQQSAGCISKQLGGCLDIQYTDDFHDRFWICNRKRGFSTGTSLNGIGKKYCVIQELESEDVYDIVKHLKDMQLLQ